MTINQAIEILIANKELPNPYGDEQGRAAQDLAIEALKRLNDVRLWHPAGQRKLLPGETKD